jgi:hypothetical protein
MTEQLAKQNPNYIPKTAQGGAIVDEFLTGHDEVNVPDVPKTATTERVTKIERLDENTFRETTVKWHLDDSTVLQIVNGVVTPTLQVLLYDVLGVIDASIPNKDQNRAVKKIIHDGFDKAYMDIVRESYPDSNFAFGPGRFLIPLSKKSEEVKEAVRNGLKSAI